MTEPKNPPPRTDADAPGSVRMGREALSNVFRSDGGSELSSHHNQRLPKADIIEPVSGPRLMHEISDSSGPADARQIDGSVPGPVQQATLTDASAGPADSRALTDATGPSDLRELRDAEGPVVPRPKIEDRYGVQDKPDLDAWTQEPPAQTSASASPLADSPAQTPPKTVHVETFSIHMEDRLAQMRASQKTTLDMMKELEPEPGDAGADHERVNKNHPAKSASGAAGDAANTATSSNQIYRHILYAAAIHPAIRTTIASNHRDIVEEVMQAVAHHAVVVVGMGGNPFVKRAKKLLQRAGIEHHYLEYGNYFSGWRRRNALKMWTGWPSFPMVFVRGTLIGGYEDLKALSDSGELAALIQR